MVTKTTYLPTYVILVTEVTVVTVVTVETVVTVVTVVIKKLFSPKNFSPQKIVIKIYN